MRFCNCLGRYIYTLFLYLILPLLPLRLWLRGRKNRGYRSHILERFGYYSSKSLQKTLWIHAVSVGEVLAALPLIKALLESYPGSSFVVTTMTPTGRERVQATLGKQVTSLYLPYDYPGAVARFLDHIDPRLAIVMETEIWPNLYYNSRKRAIPIILANARLSSRSFVGYRRLGGLMHDVFNCLTMVMAQSKLDGERFLALGIDTSKVVIAGNVKFDVAIPGELTNQIVALRSLLGVTRPIWIAASTHDTEEVKILAAARKILAQIPHALLLLVPRHPERFEEVHDLCQGEKFRTIKYSNLECYDGNTEIIVIDTMGKLLLMYGTSDLAFVGGSLIPWGGHNLLEPAVLAKPVLSGKYLQAFLDISQMMIDEDALLVVEDEKELAEKVISLFQNHELVEKLGTAALDFVEKHRGATKKILGIIANYIDVH